MASTNFITWSCFNLSWSWSNEAEFCLLTLQRIGVQPGTGFEADTVPDTVPIPNHKDTNKDILVWKLVLYPTSLKLDEISGWVGCRQQLPVLKLTQLNLETTKRQTKPFIMPWGGAWVSRRYMVVQKAQKQQHCELTQSSSVASGQGLWEAYLPGTREGCHSKEEVLHRYRGLHVYSYVRVKRPWDMQRPKVFLFCVLIKRHGNTCRYWKGWKDSVQATHTHTEAT